MSPTLPLTLKVHYVCCPGGEDQFICGFNSIFPLIKFAELGSECTFWTLADRRRHLTPFHLNTVGVRGKDRSRLRLSLRRTSGIEKGKANAFCVELTWLGCGKVRWMGKKMRRGKGSKNGSKGRIKVVKIGMEEEEGRRRRREGGIGFWSYELWLNSVCSIRLSCLSAPLEVNVFLHWVIDPTLHPGPWRRGDYRDERHSGKREMRRSDPRRLRAGVRWVKRGQESV